MQRLLVDQADITRTRIDETASPDLGAGQARLRVDRFALTANNVTYAATGFVIGYWKFFPSGQEGMGILPVWGFADVVESRAEDLPVGTRLYGFLPLAGQLVIDVQLQGDLIVDAAPHRSGLPPVYNRYVRSPPKPADQEGKRALLQPLLATSYLLADWLQDNDFFESKQIIVGSASSKTGLGLCKYLAEISNRPVQVVGLTSPRNLSFVRDHAGCDRVLPYDQVGELAKVPSVYVDMAGNGAVKARLHAHLADVLRHSCAVGTSHWDKFQPKQELAGPKPQFFFAPSQIEKRRADWGPGVIEHKIGEAWKRVAAEADSWLDLVPHHGLESVPGVYGALARGEASARDGHIITL